MMRRDLQRSIVICLNLTGVVQANVEQKLVKRNILRVFLVSKNQDPQATFCLNNA